MKRHLARLCITDHDLAKLAADAAKAGMAVSLRSCAEALGAFDDQDIRDVITRLAPDSDALLNMAAADETATIEFLRALLRDLSAWLVGQAEGIDRRWDIDVTTEAKGGAL